MDSENDSYVWRRKYRQVISIITQIIKHQQITRSPKITSIHSASSMSGFMHTELKEKNYENKIINIIFLYFNFHENINLPPTKSYYKYLRHYFIKKKTNLLSTLHLYFHLNFRVHQLPVYSYRWVHLWLCIKRGLPNRYFYHSLISFPCDATGQYPLY